MDFTWSKNENEISEVICLITNDPYKKDAAPTINACDRVVVPVGKSFIGISYHFEDDAVCSTLFDFKNDSEEEQIYYFDGKVFYINGNKVAELPSLGENSTFFFLLTNITSKPFCFKYEWIDKSNYFPIGAADIVVLIKINGIDMNKAFGESWSEHNLPVCLEFLDKVIYPTTARGLNSEDFKSQFSSLVDPKYNYFTFSMMKVMTARSEKKDPLMGKAVDYLNNYLINKLSSIGIKAEVSYVDFEGYDFGFYLNDFSDAIKGN